MSKWLSFFFFYNSNFRQSTCFLRHSTVVVVIWCLFDGRDFHCCLFKRSTPIYLNNSTVPTTDETPSFDVLEFTDDQFSCFFFFFIFVAESSTTSKMYEQCKKHWLRNFLLSPKPNKKSKSINILFFIFSGPSGTYCSVMFSSVWHNVS